MAEYNGFNGFNLTDVSYAGTVELDYIITPAVFGMDTINKGLAMVKSGIKKSHNVERINLAYPLQQRVPTPDVASTGRTITFENGVKLTPHSAMGMQRLLPAAFEENFFAEQLSDTLLARELPRTPSNYILSYFMSKCFEGLEQNLHMGSTTYGINTGSTYYGTKVGDANEGGQLQFFDGIVKQMLVAGPYTAGTNVNGYIDANVSGETSITITNIESAFRNAYSSVPKAILANPARMKNLKFVVSVEDDLIYEEMLTLTTFKNNNYTEEGVRKYRGIPVVKVAGLNSGTFYLGEFVASPDSILWIGLSSYEDLQLQLGKLYEFSEEWFVKFLIKLDCKIAKPNEFVMWTNKKLTDF